MIDTLLAFDLATLAAFMGASVVLYLTPGADMMFTIASGAAGGPRAGLAAAAGISLGVLAHTALAAAGLAALILAYPAAYDAIRWAGAAYLAFLAWQMWRADPRIEAVAGRAMVWRAFRRGFVTNILNPKVGLFVMAFLPQFTDPANGPVWQQIVWLGLILATGGIVADGAYGVFAGYLADRVRKGAGTMNKLAALVFGGLAIRLAAN